MTDLMIFEGHEVEVFEFEGQVLAYGIEYKIIKNHAGKT